MGNKGIKEKRCPYCGRYFRPDYRVGGRQKACKEKACQARRKREAQRRWLKANHGYFNGRYEYIKQWRREHPDYQRRWRASIRTKRGEIQDEIRLVRQCGCGFFVAGLGMQDTRRDCIT